MDEKGARVITEKMEGRELKTVIYTHTDIYTHTHICTHMHTQRTKKQKSQNDYEKKYVTEVGHGGGLLHY